MNKFSSVRLKAENTIITFLRSTAQRLPSYLDGQKTGEANISGFYFTANKRANYLCIGADSSEAQTNEYFWDGSIAKANIYSGALSAEQVAMLYENR